MSSLTDSYYEIHNKMKTLINDVDCLPDWETMVEYEFIRQEGKFNMFSFCSNQVQRHAFDCGLYHFVTWVEQIRKSRSTNIISYLGKAYAYYESNYGPRENWITKDFRHKVKQTLKENKCRQLKLELQRLEQNDDDE